MKTPQTETAAKKDVLKLQRAIVDGLEDVKAQDIQVFNTEQLSPLFERVIIASGTSNRQTKALASSVRDAVREAGFDKPRIEGEENGEWIIVDCGPAVAHIMQPAIRQYYHLEDLWGETPVRLKLGAAKPVAASAEDKPAKASKSTAAAKPARKKAGAAADAGTASEEKPRRASRTTAKPASSDAAPATAKRAAPRKRVAGAGDDTLPKASATRKTPARKAASATQRSVGSDSATAKAPAKKAAVRVTVVKPALGAASTARKAAAQAAKPGTAVRKKTPAKRSS